jgi:hypothetical protein
MRWRSPLAKSGDRRRPGCALRRALHLGLRHQGRGVELSDLLDAQRSLFAELELADAGQEATPR